MTRGWLAGKTELDLFWLCRRALNEWKLGFPREGKSPILLHTHTRALTLAHLACFLPHACSVISKLKSIKYCFSNKVPILPADMVL